MIRLTWSTLDLSCPSLTFFLHHLGPVSCFLHSSTSPYVVWAEWTAWRTEVTRWGRRWTTGARKEPIRRENSNGRILRQHVISLGSPLHRVLSHPPASLESSVRIVVHSVHSSLLTPLLLPLMIGEPGKWPSYLGCYHSIHIAPIPFALPISRSEVRWGKRGRMEGDMEGKELQPIISSAWRLSPSIGSSLKVLMISSEHQFFHRLSRRSSPRYVLRSLRSLVRLSVWAT